MTQVKRLYEGAAMARGMLAVVMLALAAGASRDTYGAASPDPALLRVTAEEVARARRLVRLLGSDIYRERDTATRELAAMGRKALVALDESRADPDPEVFARVNGLRPRAARDDLQARVETFLADREARYTHDVPAWNKFRFAAGDDLAARELFAEVAANRANADLLIALGGAGPEQGPGLAALAGAAAGLGLEAPPPEKVLPTLLARRQLQLTLAQAMPGVPAKAPQIPDIALLLLAESYAPESALRPGNTQSITANYFSYGPGRDAILGAQKYSPALRGLLELWLETRQGAYARVNAMSLVQGLNWDPETVARFAARVLTAPPDGGANNPHTRVAAVAVIVRLKARSQLPAIQSLFADDRTVLKQANVGGYDIAVCDFALAAALHLTGQKPADYGFTVQNLNPTMQANYTNFYFRGDATATAGAKARTAFARWREYEAGVTGSVVGAPFADAVVRAKYPVKEPKEVPKPKGVEDPLVDD